MNSSLNDAQASPGLQPLSQDALSDEEMSGYEPAIEAVFSQPAMRNIALSGPASADKLALANGWKAKRNPDTWLTVSAPHFNYESAHVTAGESEDAIVNQIVAQMDPAKSPKTRFRSQMKRDGANDIATGLVAAAFAVLSVFLIWIAGLLPSARPPFALCALAFVAWVACVGYGAYRIARTGAIGRLLARLKRNGGDIELAAGPNDSRIERYMGELVYLLNANDYDNVIFDGIDSYRRTPLFERLRALNELANDQRGEGRAPLRFFYLVGDGAFADPHERTRFFDFIVPVIPYMDPTALLSKFRSGLADVGLAVDEDFLAELSSFIDDPNILRDIVNEAHLYATELLDEGSAAKGDRERLVALLAYKALFPRDFELLQIGQGYLSALLKSRTAIISEMRARNMEGAQLLTDELSVAQEEGDADRVAEVEALLEELERQDVECSRMSLAQLLESMDDPEPIFENPPASGDMSASYRTSMLANPGFAFIRTAVTRGWIDTTYERFMNNFYAESLTPADRELISTIAQGQRVRPERTADDISAVISHLDADAFALESARIFSLLDHLLDMGPADKLEGLFRGIGHDDDLAWLLSYTESRPFNGAVFSAMERALGDPIERILADESVELVRRRRFAHRLLAYATNVLEQDQVRAAARDFAHADPAFLHVDCVEPMGIAAGLAAIGYRPAELECNGCDQELLQYVYANDLYDPTARAIDDMLAALLNVECALPGGYLATRIYSLTGTAVKEVVEDNAERFVSTLLEDSQVKFADAPEAVAWVLNLEGLPSSLALRYLDTLSEEVRIEWLATIENPAYQGVLLDRDLVSNTPANILDYFASSGSVLDAHLAGFLSTHPFPADFTMATTEQHLGQESGFLKSIIECDALSDAKVSEITAAYRAQFNHFDMEGLSHERIEMLVRTGIIRTTEDNLLFVRQHCPSAVKHLAENDIAAYVDLVLPDETGAGGQCGFSRDEAAEILQMSSIVDEGKIALLAGLDEPVALSASNSNDLNAAIVAGNFDVNDLPLIDELYTQGNRKLKRALAEAALSYLERLSSEGLLLSMEMVADIAWRMHDDRAAMVGFIASQLSGRTEEPTRFEVRSIFERADLKEYVTLMAGPSAMIPATPEDDALIDALTQLGMAGKQAGKADADGLRRVNSKGYSRK